MNSKITEADAREMVDREIGNLAHLRDIRFEVRVELGRLQMSLNAFAQLQPGGLITLNKRVGRSYDVRVNDRLFAHGDIVVGSDLISCRIKQIAAPEASGITRAFRETIAYEAIERGPELMEDVMGMVAVPGGSFVMGSNEGDSPDNERPTHTLDMSPYYIDAYPVTNHSYQEFVNATSHRAPPAWHDGTYPVGTSRHPVVNVSWEDANEYARWRGKRLPTEAEWEKAARGNDGRLYPWGNHFVDGERCNSNNLVGTTTPVDEFPLGRSPYGAWDMAGNAYEWCADFYQSNYYPYSPDLDPQGPDTGEERVIRGGFYAETRPNVRTIHRNSAPQDHANEHIGFRLAQSAVEIAAGEEKRQ